MFRHPHRPFRPMPGKISRQVVHEQMTRKGFQMQASANPQEVATTCSNLARQTSRNGQQRQSANLHAQVTHNVSSTRRTGSQP